MSNFENSTGKSLVEVSELVIDLGDPKSGRKIVRIGPVSLSIVQGTCTGIVGRSGAGKSTVALALLGMLSPQGRIVSGSVKVDGRSLFDIPNEELRQMRGSTMSMVFQDPSVALNPVRRLDRFFRDVISAHDRCSNEEIVRRTDVALRSANLDPEIILHRYPHELSGGMRQRVMVALAVLNKPKVVIADEPTTALDPTTELEVLDLFAQVRKTNTLIVITHDLRVTRRLCDFVAVMEAGSVVEYGKASEVLQNPQHEVTKRLLSHETRGARRLPSLKSSGIVAVHPAKQSEAL